MTKIPVVFVLVLLCFAPLHARRGKHSQAHSSNRMPMFPLQQPFPDPLPPAMMHHYSEVQIRGRLKKRYAMSDADIEVILKARRQILDVMQKYRPEPGQQVPASYKE